ncbi:tRNA(Ile)-lysidine synthase [Cypionkella aquatica]|uniref:tRNA(Ile)-lysidine synthase n=1 Tax=Cypionkella aquatica TaxID=1756042 RepID=A0AA37X0C6_9RHOB|nr:tRNA lysidine(34) synthetase TilS [Cypionkella aquatica]GLS85625.1 tRNA(Ile)-lysidine synthase [Cypionkella aquatica]
MPVGAAPPDPDAQLLEIASKAYPDTARIGVMVSGGGDSMALLHLLQRCHPGRVAALTIDHGLRAEARAEAEMVAAFCAARAIPHQISLWQRKDVAGNLMDAARRARYQIAEAWAVAQDIAQIAVGHTADDQAETFLIGLARQAGIDGLSGMRSSWGQGQVQFSRPLLGVSRADLRGYLRRHAVNWVEDPSNSDLHYTRVKARNALATLADFGITATKLAVVADNLESARWALTRQMAEAAQGFAQTATGMLTLPRETYLALPAEIQRRLLIAALRWMSGAAYPPREHGLAAVQTALAAGKDATLGGVRYRCHSDAIQILREAKAVQDMQVPTDQRWDNRWQLSGPHAPDLTIGALGADGLSCLKAWRDLGIPRDALLVSPAIWRNQTLIAAPVAGFSNGWCANCSPSFASFVLSH